MCILHTYYLHWETARTGNYHTAVPGMVLHPHRLATDVPFFRLQLTWIDLDMILMGVVLVGSPFEIPENPQCRAAWFEKQIGGEFLKDYRGVGRSWNCDRVGSSGGSVIGGNVIDPFAGVWILFSICQVQGARHCRTEFSQALHWAAPGLSITHTDDCQMRRGRRTCGPGNQSEKFGRKLCLSKEL